MPARDGTGPCGEGPLTGRRLGPCDREFRGGFGPGYGRGYGRGYGYGRGFGRGFGRFWTAPPASVQVAPITLTKEEQKRILEEDLKALEEDMKYVKEKLKELNK